MNKRFRMSSVEIGNFVDEMSLLYGDINKSYVERISELIGQSLDESANILHSELTSGSQIRRLVVLTLLFVFKILMRR